MWETVIAGVILSVWAVGAAWRVRRQGRYFQIEEYKNLRYLAWVIRRRAQAVPTRILMAGAGGAVLSIFFSEAPNSPLPYVIGLIAAVIALPQPHEAEVKKPLRITARVRRLLGAAWGLIVVMSALLLGISGSFTGDLLIAMISISGMIVSILAPLWLVIANIALTPVEGIIRAGFIRSAKQIIAEINPVVIGITGSYGKTSTKQALAHILNGRYRAYATPKSYNTMMGVCAAINNDLATDRSIDYFVVEMGAYIPGEIERLCGLTPPTIALVIEVGPQHLERFGSLENISIAKYEIIKALPSDGVGVFNWDNPYVRAMYERDHPATRLTISKDHEPTPAEGDAVPRFVASAIVETIDGLRFTVTDRQTGESAEMTTRLLGIHNVTNLLMATAVAVNQGMSLREIARRVTTLTPSESRLVKQVTTDGITILNDGYSTNPVGSISALRTLGLHTSGRRLLITPGMIELADQHDRENHALGVHAAAHATDVILVGATQTAPIRTGLMSAGFPETRLLVVETLRDAIAWYREHLRAGDTVLFLNDLPDTYSA